MRDWKSILGVTLVFVLGMLAGAFISLTFAHHRVTTLLQRGSPAFEQLLERRLSRGLDLDADQRTHFHEAFMNNIAQRRQVQLQVQPQMQALNAQTAHELRAILNPNQLAVFRHNLAEFRKRYGTPGMSNGRAFDADAESSPDELGSTNAAPNHG